MSWGRKKKTRKTSSASSMPGRGMGSIAKMFPISWLSKLRQRNGNENERRSEQRISGRKAKDVTKRNVGLQYEEEKSRRAENFYGETEENYWRLSFNEEGVRGRKSVGECPESYNLLDETDFSPSASTCTGCGTKGVSKAAKERKSIDFNDMLLDMRKSKDSNPQAEAKAKTRTDVLITRERKKSEVSRRDGKLKNLCLHQPSHGLNRDAKYVKLKVTDKKAAKADPNIHTVKDIAEVAAMKPPQASVRTGSGSPTLLSSQHQGLECKKSGDVNLAEFSLGAGEERKSIYINKDSLNRRSKSGGRGNKVKVYSPRTPSKAELCKIRALEDLKKTRMKMRVKEKAVMESLAVVKRSVNPQRDFRNSMLEMILDKKISQPEELEELLACYLILNSDEYHDMIIKVFRQVWFDLNKDRLDPSSRDAELYNN